MKITKKNSSIRHSGGIFLLEYECKTRITGNIFR